VWPNYLIIANLILRYVGNLSYKPYVFWLSGSWDVFVHENLSAFYYLSFSGTPHPSDHDFNKRHSTLYPRFPHKCGLFRLSGSWDDSRWLLSVSCKNCSAVENYPSFEIVIYLLQITFLVMGRGNRKRQIRVIKAVVTSVSVHEISTAKQRSVRRHFERYWKSTHNVLFKRRIGILNYTNSQSIAIIKWGFKNWCLHGGVE
jgi:hypothetical protein